MALTQQLAVTVHMSDDSTEDVTADATFESDDVEVATVSAGGLITAVGVGECTVTATYESFTADCAVTVDPAPGG